MLRILPVLILFIPFWAFANFSNPSLLMDTIKPVITCPNNMTVTLGTGKCDTVLTYTVTASDNEPGFTVIQVVGIPPGDKYDIGTVTNRFRVTDAAGLTATCAFNVTVSQASSTLICRDNTTLSLDSLCEARPQAIHFLEGIYGCINNMKLEIDKVPPLGNGPWVAALFDVNDLGKTYQARVTDQANINNRCWGSLKLEDRASPKIKCTTLNIPCVIDASPAFLADSLKIPNARPAYSDGCSNNLTLNFIDSKVTGGCDSAFIERINRRWIVTDASGNTASCFQLINRNRIPESAIVMPADVTLSCPNPNISPTKTGFPTFTFAGRTYTDFCTINSTFKDILAPSCEGNMTWLRQWEFINWCTGKIYKDTQFLYVQDKKGPIVACPTNPVVKAKGNNCLGVVDLPDATVYDVCSKPASLKAFWKINGQNDSLTAQFTSFSGNNPAIHDSLGVFGVDSLFPLGLTQVMLVAADLCGNTSTCTYTLQVWDSVPPVASCVPLRIVDLDQAGQGSLSATQLNDKSADPCGAISFLARRSKPGICQPTSGFYPFLQFCCADVNDTIDVDLRVYDVVVPPDSAAATYAQGQFSSCKSKVWVRNFITPRCTAPKDTVVECAKFNPDLSAYGNASEFSCTVDSVFLEVNLSQFDTLCARGTISRVWHLFDQAKKDVASCSQQISVVYKQDFFVRMPDDRIITSCNNTNIYGEPVFLGQDCEDLTATYTDEIFTVVPDACFKIERRWKIFNWCTHKPNLPLTKVPNPNPNITVNAPANHPGPIISAGNTASPWNPTIVKVAPSDPVTTNYSIYYTGGNGYGGVTVPAISSADFNGFEYIQIIKILDSEDPIIDYCPRDLAVTIGDKSSNDPNFWNESYWLEPATGLNDMREAEVNLSITSSDLCSPTNVSYLLSLDLNQDGVMETTVHSNDLGLNGLGWNNLRYNNLVASPGINRAFDQRPVPANQKYGWAIKNTINGDTRTSSVVWNTQQVQNQYVLPRLPHGIHRIKWFAEDGCGNESTCEYRFEIGDKYRLPLLKCDTLIVKNIDPLTVSATVQLSDIQNFALSNQALPNKVELAMRRAGTGIWFPTSKSVTYKCNELGDHSIELWARDSSGRLNSCAFRVSVRDLDKNCEQPGPFTVAGSIRTMDNKGVNEVTVSLSGPGIFPNKVALSTTDGRYEIPGKIAKGTQYTLTPQKINGPLNGVSTYDLVLISKHILGLEPLDSPYKMIAADANKSNSITTLDIVTLRRLILGIDTLISGSDSWRFVPISHTFNDPSNPFISAFPDKFSNSGIQTNELISDFVAIKIGDLNLNSDPNGLLQAEDRNAPVLWLEAAEKIYQAGDVLHVALSSEQPLQGYQFTFEHPDFELLDVSGDRMGAAHFAQHPAALSVSMEQSGLLKLHIQFRANKAGKLSENLRFSDRFTRSEAYLQSSEARPSNLQLRFRDAQGEVMATKGRFSLYANAPNPFAEQTHIGFYLPYDGLARLEITDMQGRMVWARAANYSRGEHQVSISREQLPAAGLYCYRLMANGESVARKMVVE